MINTFGIKNILHPVELNYLFLIESDNVFQEPTYGESISIDTCSEKNHDCILNDIYDRNKKDSVVNELSSFFNVNSNKYAYLYTSKSEDLSMFNNNLISLKQSANDNLKLVEELTKKKYPLRSSLNECVNEVT